MIIIPSHLTTLTQLKKLFNFHYAQNEGKFKKEKKARWWAIYILLILYITKK